MNEDQDILELLRNGDDRSIPFKLIFERYHKKVYWHTRRMIIDHEDANDITQNIFIKIWSGISSFKGDAKLSSWIFRITANETINFIKSKKLRAALSFQDFESSLSNKLSDQTVFNGTEIERRLQKAILSLPAKQRQVFLLRYYEEMPYEKMSEVLNTSVGALKSSYHHASAKVEKIVQSI